MPITIASYLKSTYELLKRAYPHGIDAQSYFPLLTLLSNEMSDRNLAEVVSYYTGQEYAMVLNDIYQVQSVMIPSPESLANVKEHLLAVGYQDWLDED